MGAGQNLGISESMDFDNNFLFYTGMPKRTQSVIVEDIISFIGKIDSYTGELSYQEFSLKPMVVDACLHNIQIIGDAIATINDETRHKADTIPWTLISGMRGRLISDSLEADHEVVWHVITNALPELKHKLERLHKRLVARNL
ncbi:MAG: DUF86 domain-containing protein [Chitinophagaceae bacterium]|nr:DUF86 domain-containing protein [Chitinophagaceae bacterium]